MLCAILFAAPAYGQTMPDDEPSTLSADTPVSIDHELLLEVEVNGRPQGTQAMRHDASGTFHATVEQLEAWGVKRPDTHAPLALRDPIKVRLDRENQILSIEFPPQMLPTTRVRVGSAGSAGAFDAGPDSNSELDVVPSVFVNYAVQAEQTAGQRRANALIDVGAAVGPGMLTSSQVVQQAPGQARAVRLDTAWTIDEPDKLRRTVIGDSIANAGQWGKAIRFGGVRWGTDFSLRPDLVTFPVPTLRGSATVPSTVDVLVNGNRVASQEVAAGPFEINSLPVITGQGTVSLRVQDALGRTQLISQPFYSSAALLAPGLSNYSVAAGAVREVYLQQSNRYNNAFVMGQYRAGIDQDLTLEGRGEVSGRHVATGAGFARQIGHRMVVQGSLAASWQPDSASRDVSSGNTVSIDRTLPGASTAIGNTRQGVQASLGIEQSGPVWRYSASHTYSTAGFVQLGDARLQSPQAVPVARNRRSTQFYGGVTMGAHSLGASWIDRSDEYGRDRFQALNYSVNIGNAAGVASGALLSAYIGRSGTGGAMAGLTLIIPLGERHSMSLSAQRDNGRSRYDTIYQMSPPAGEGIGARVRSSGPDRIDSATITRHSHANLLSIDVARSDHGGGAARAFASGSLLLTDGRIASVRNDGSSVAAMKVADYAGVKVYLENREAGVTDRDGRVLIAGLRPYQINHLSIESQDLPLDAQVDSLEIDVRPPARSVVAIRPKLSAIQPLLARLVMAEQQTLPSSAVVYRADGSALPTGVSGEVVLKDPRPGERLTARWGSHSCHAVVSELPSRNSAEREASSRWHELPCRP